MIADSGDALRAAIGAVVERAERSGDCNWCGAEICRGSPHELPCEIGLLKRTILGALLSRPAEEAPGPEPSDDNPILAALRSYRSTQWRYADGEPMELADMLGPSTPSIAPALQELERIADHISGELYDAAVRAGASGGPEGAYPWEPESVVYGLTWWEAQRARYIVPIMESSGWRLCEYDGTGPFRPIGPFADTLEDAIVGAAKAANWNGGRIRGLPAPQAPSEEPK